MNVSADNSVHTRQIVRQRALPNLPNAMYIDHPRPGGTPAAPFVLPVVNPVPFRALPQGGFGGYGATGGDGVAIGQYPVPFRFPERDTSF
jgi:hypothetical protein